MIGFILVIAMMMALGASRLHLEVDPKITIVTLHIPNEHIPAFTEALAQQFPQIKVQK